MTPDEIRQAIIDGLHSAGHIREACGSAVSGVQRMAKSINDLPEWLPHTSELADLDGFDLDTLAEDLINSCPELDHLMPYPIAFRWWTSARTSRNRALLGTARAVSKRDRACWIGLGPAPFWYIDLSLPYWLLCDDMERARLLHHEMMHCAINVSPTGKVTPTTKPHDVEEFGSTVGRFGFGDAAQFALASNGTHHPGYADRAKEWGFTAEGQGLLFGEWKPLPTLRAVEG